MTSSIEALSKEHSPSLIVLCGDMNEVPGEQALATLTQGPLFFQRLTKSTAEGTCVKNDGSGESEDLDHIFAVAPGTDVDLSLDSVPAPVRSEVSDHSMIAVHSIQVRAKGASGSDRGAADSGTQGDTPPIGAAGVLTSGGGS